MSLDSRSRISVAALFVKVTAHIDVGGMSCSKIKWAILDVRTFNDIRIRWQGVCAFSDDTLVFPLPGPANICNGISGSCSTA